MIPSGMSTLHRRLAVLALSVVAPALLSARQAAQPATAGDMIDRIFKTREFTARPPAPAQWLDGGASYVVVETSPTGQNAVVKYDSATGAKREVAISAAQLTPAGASGPLEIEELSWSADGQRVLVFTNTRRVWRTNSRGDYWLLDRRAGTLKKLGGDVPEASLMYAQFNADATKVAYVRQNDIYVEDLCVAGLGRTRLAKSVHDDLPGFADFWLKR